MVWNRFWKGFNPSSIGIGFRRSFPGVVAIAHHPVSILLLLELAFEDRVHKRAMAPRPRFNPSSIGIGFRSVMPPPLRTFQSYVSILLLLELAFEAERGIFSITSGAKFQSFFYWNWLSKAPCKRSEALTACCFNPSSIGIGFRRYCPTGARNGRSRFQSFFYWNWLSKWAAILLATQSLTGFQSFFYWNWLSKLSLSYQTQ